jgi:hypothetical protein
MLQPTHWLSVFLVSKTVGHHFWPGLMAGSVIWGHGHLSYYLHDVHPKFNFFWQRANLIGPSLRKIKLWRLPKIEGSILKYRVPPLLPTYIGERRTTFAKA